MPLYEYRCRACTHIFEVLVRGPERPTTCPACSATDLEQLISMFAVASEGTRKAALESGRKQNRKMQIDKAIADREEIEHHRH
jgi:putative FmdB family regulatory protein